MTWDVYYVRPGGLVLVVEVEAFSISSARTAALPIVGSRSTIVRVEQAARPLDDHADRIAKPIRTQGASR